MNTDGKDVERIVDADAVTQLVLRERHNRDRGWWDEWSKCFAEDSIVNMSWFRGRGDEFVRQTRLRSADAVWGRHRLSPPTVRIHGDRGWAELPLGIEFRLTVGDLEADLVSYCRSQYRVQRVGDVWRIVRLTSIYERDSLTPSVPGTTLDLEPGEFARYRPSYRCLAWYFDRAGTPLPTTLLGDDQPDGVIRQYEEELAWLNPPDTASKPADATTKEQ